MNEDEKKYIIKFRGKGVVDLGNKNHPSSHKEQYEIIEKEKKKY